MSVKTWSCLRYLWARLSDLLFGDGWIELILMLFILGAMVYNHVN